MGNNLILALATATVLSGVLLKGDTPYALSVPSDALTLEYENENVIL